MKIAGLLDDLTVKDIDGQTYTLKKWPYGFEEWLASRSLADVGAEVEPAQPGKDGKPTKAKVRVTRVADFDPELPAKRIFYGLNAWSLKDETGQAVPLTLGECLNLVTRYGEHAARLDLEIRLFNSQLKPDEEKKSS